MGNSQNNKKINFEDVQRAIKNPESYIIINTLKDNEQDCLIFKTTPINQEETIINSLLREKKNVLIIIYGKNCNDETTIKKYNQLIYLGFYNIFIYPGGLFEWLMLQDIFGNEEFPTTTTLLDFIKYKPPSIMNIHLLTY
jgi:hypothetical protein